MPAAVGTSLHQRYRLDAELGRGGMGAVYRAHDASLQRDVAVKVLSTIDPESRLRLVHEARAAAALNHPHVVGVYDVGEDEGAAFIVMELVPGGSLREAPQPSIAETVAIIRQLCDALAHAHGHGIVHRDVKPENVLLARDGDVPLVKLADLGIARSDRGTRITEAGTLMGTAAYLAPEQALGLEVDGRADLYAVGVMMYELLTGRLPFAGDDPLTVVSQHLHAPVVPPRTFRPDIPPALEAIVLRLLAKTPAERFPGALELDAALAEAPLDAPSDAGEAERSGAVTLLDQLARGRLVGRTRELQELRELWRRAQQGHGHMALLSGEPGAGKTRLAREVIVYAQLTGATVLKGGCYEYEATTPYLPIVEALRAWVNDTPADALRLALADAAPELARLAPEIETKLGALPPSASLAPHEERLRLFDRVARLLQTLAAPRGLLLFVDDLHWADQGTIALLHYVLRHLKDERLLVLGAYRELELDRAHPLSAALVEWNRERLATRVQIGRFTREQTDAQLAALLGQVRVSPEFGEAVHRETEGNPFFVEEVLKALIEQGQIYRGGGQWQRGSVGDMTIPQSVKAAIGRRLDRLSPACADALHTAAALGKVFDFAELAAVAGKNEDELLDALDEAVAAQLLASPGGDAFAFTHDKIREVLYEELNPVRRRRLHQRIGEGLETLHAAHLEAHAQDLAHHFLESGDLARGMAYARQAAEQSKRVFAQEEAVEFYQRALECADALQDEDARLEFEVALARTHFAIGSIPEGARHGERALALTSDPRQRAELMVLLAKIYNRIGDPRGLAMAEDAVRALDRTRDPLLVAEALTQIGRRHHHICQHRRAVELYEEALALAEPTGTPEVIGGICSFMAGAYQHLALYPQSNAYADRCVQIGTAAGAPSVTALGYEFRGENAFNQGLWRDALSFAHQDHEIGERIHSLERVAWSTMPETLGHFGLGELRLAREACLRSLAVSEQIGETRLGMFMRGNLALIESDLGLSDEARARAEANVPEADASGLLLFRGQSRFALAYVLAAMGRWEDVVVLSAATLDLLEPTDSRVNYIWFDWLHAESRVRVGRLDEARQRIDEALARARNGGAPCSEALVRRSEALLLGAQGHYADAEGAFADAIAGLETLEARLQLGRTHAYRAEAREARGDRGNALDDWREARALFEACGAPRDLASAEARLAGK